MERGQQGIWAADGRDICFLLEYDTGIMDSSLSQRVSHLSSAGLGL